MIYGDTVKEIDNIGIIILLRLLCGGDALKFDVSIFDNDRDASIHELQQYSNLVLWQFSDVVKCGYKHGCSISVTDRTKLNELVHQYIKEYTLGELVETKSAYTSYKALLKEFKASIDNDLNLNRYVVKDLKYMPVILAMYDDDISCIKEVSIDLTDKGDVPYPIWIEGNDRWNEYFTYKVVVDVNSLFKRKHVKTAEQNTGMQTLKGYTHKMKQFDLFLTDLVRNGTYSFSKMDVVERGITISIGGFTTMFSRYKDVYRQCYPEYTFENDKPETHAVMYNSEQCCYDIKRINPETSLYIGIEHHLSKG